MLKAIIFSIGFAVVISANAQVHRFTHIGVEEGLPSETVYKVLQDQDGFIWFATDAGLVKYDGYTLRHFTTKNGLTNNEVISIYQDENERLWAMPFNAGLCVHKEDSFCQVTGLEERVEGKVWAIESHHNGYFIRTTKDAVYYSSKDFSKIKEVFPTDTICYMLKLKNGTHLFFGNNKIIFWKDGRVQKEIAADIPSSFMAAYELNNGTIVYSTINGGMHVISDPNKITKIKVASAFLTGKRISTFLQDKGGGIWVGTVEGIIRFDNDEFQQFSGPYLKNSICTSINEDREGNIWITTEGDGVYFLSENGRRISILNNETGLSESDVNKLAFGNDIYLALANDKLYKLANGKLILHTDFSSTNTEAQSVGLAVDSHNRIWVGLDQRFEGLAVYNGKKWEYVSIGGTTKEIYIPENSKKVFIATGGAVYAITYDDISTIKKQLGSTENVGQIQRVWGKYKLFGERSYALQLLRDTLWIGNISGLYAYANNKVMDFTVKSPHFSQSISDLAVDRKNRLWISTLANGIVVKDGTKVFTITEDNDLQSGICRTMFGYKENMFVGTNKGIAKINTNDFAITGFDVTDGLPSNDIKNINGWNDTLYCATRKGMAFFAISEMKTNQIPPLIYLYDVTVSGRKLKHEELSNLTYQQNSLTIRFAGLSFKNPATTTYLYKLEGVSDSWQTTKSTTIEYPKLSEGSYRLTIYAISGSGVKSEYPIQVSFTILPPFWKTWWFTTVLIAVIILVVVLVFLSRVRKIEKREKQRTEIERKISQIELKALRAQMNPHFTFNALNSIQNLINQKDLLNANIYLVKFAELLRAVLENSREAMVSLRDELKYLELYLELEKLRFGGKMEFDITKQAELDDKKWAVPPMLIQPYVENAMKHGLLHKDGQGKVSLYLSQTDDHLICRVEDDGVGREKAGKINAQRKKSHQSLGTKLNEERLELIGHEWGAGGKVLITDLINEKGVGNGTRVEIFLPLVSLKHGNA